MKDKIVGAVSLLAVIFFCLTESRAAIFIVPTMFFFAFLLLKATEKEKVQQICQTS